eukprot:scaffold96638_cov30-Tisochrysis_lutea.AAC.2
MRAQGSNAISKRCTTANPAKMKMARSTTAASSPYRSTLGCAIVGVWKERFLEEIGCKPSEAILGTTECPHACAKGDGRDGRQDDTAGERQQRTLDARSCPDSVWAEGPPPPAAVPSSHMVLSIALDRSPALHIVPSPSRIQWCA